VWRVTSLQFQLEPLASPGFALLITSIAGVVNYKLSWRQILDCALRTIQQVYPAAVSMIGFVAMSTVMQQGGMIDFLARDMAVCVGSGFMLISPIIGGLGGFITGSNSAANAMLGPFQNAMAHQLHDSPLLYATVQNVAASNLTMESPSRVARAASITNVSGQDGQLSRRILPLGFLVIVLTTVSSLLLASELAK
jgi:lactate permease